MKFLIDAQLPKRLANRLRNQGHDAVHTLDLPAKNRTGDEDVNELSLKDGRVVVTKDGDFVDSFLLRRRPYKLLWISTGNIGNRELERLFSANLGRVVRALDEYDFVELDRTSLIVRR